MFPSNRWYAGSRPPESTAPRGLLAATSSRSPSKRSRKESERACAIASESEWASAVPPFRLRVLSGINTMISTDAIANAKDGKVPWLFGRLPRRSGPTEIPVAGHPYLGGASSTAWGRQTMVHIRDDGVFDAPIDKLWKYIQDNNAHQHGAFVVQKVLDQK